MSTWSDLIQIYASTPIKHSELKLVTLAQWALESNFGSSDLATQHLNFAGLKFRARVNKGREDNPLAFPVDYEAHDGIDTYCKFQSIEDFIAGYWAFIENGAHYDGWEAYASDPGGYISHLHEAGYATDPDYVSKVVGLLPRIRQQVRDGGNSALAEAASEPVSSLKVALLIGHNQKQQGAFSDHMQVSEWVFNQRIAKLMKQMESEYELEIKTFFRNPNPSGYSAEIAAAYAAIDNWDPMVILELHFNSGGGHGSEMLYWHTSGRGKILAKAVQNAVVGELGLNSRGAKGRKNGDRGSTSLSASSIPTILAEPFFGDSKSDCDLMLSLPNSALARAYLIGIRDALKELL